MARSAMVTQIVRYALFAIFLVGAGWLVHYYFAPPPQPKFDALEALTFEALAMDEENGGDRLTFPSKNLAEIRQFFTANGGLTFTLGSLGSS